MKRVEAIFLTGFFLSFIVLTSGCSVQSGGGGTEGGGRSYFPDTQGYAWHYQSTDGARTVTVEGTRLVSGETTVKLFNTHVYTSGGVLTSYYDDFYQVTDSGVYYYGSSLSPLDLKRTILVFPLSVGKSWTVYSTGEETRTASVTGSEDMTVPAGTFSCYKVSYVSWRGTVESSSADIWYGDGVGMVKSVTRTVSTIESVLEWKSF